MNNKHLFVFLTAFTVVLLDQASKFIIRSSMELGQSMPVLNNIFHITYVHNFGAGFGILQEQRIFLALVSIGVAAFIFYYLKKVKEKERLLQIILGLVLGGTIGNLIDRIIYGYVIDFLDFRIWPVFNAADSAVTLGIMGLVIYFWKK
jgi:signal peptidase II